MRIDRQEPSAIARIGCDPFRQEVVFHDSFHPVFFGDRYKVAVIRFG